MYSVRVHVAQCTLQHLTVQLTTYEYDVHTTQSNFTATLHGE